MKNIVKHFKRERIKSVTKHPYFGYILFGVILIIVMALSTYKILPYSFATSLTNTLIYSIVAIGFTYLLGYAGLASLGTAGFVGMGAYIVAIMLGTFNLNVPFPLILILGIVIAVALGVVVGFISLRIEGIFLAIVTLGLSEVFFQIFLNATSLTGGPNGIRLPDFPNIIGNFGFDRLSMMIFIALVVVFLMILTHNMGNSVTGRAMLAMKNSTSAAQAMGISLLKYRLLAFVLSTAYAGIAGVMFMSFVRYTDPYSWSLMFSLNILAACIFGGSRNLWGVLFGTFIVFGIIPMFLQDIAFLRDNSWMFNVIIGIALILIVLFYRGGVVQLVNDIKHWYKNKRQRMWVSKYGRE